MFLLFWLLLNTVAAANVNYICTSNHTAVMESDNVIFFESPDFPRHMTVGEINQCYINFAKTLGAKNNSRFVVVISNILCQGKCKIFFESFQDVSSYFFRLKDQFDMRRYEAFQGFAYFDDWGDICPLESVSRINPFHFTDLSEIMVIRSTFDPHKPRKQSCLWQFTAPENFGFKIVVTTLNTSDTTVFKVENIQDTIITSANVRVAYPHYTMDNYLKIYLSENIDAYVPTDEYNLPTFEFSAYISIIKNFFHDEQIKCNESASTSYPSNARCTFKIKVLPKTEVIASAITLEIEENVDMINYYYDNNSKPNIYGQIREYSRTSDNIVFSTYGYVEKEILWEFVSDGSAQSGGFEIDFATISCTCGNPIITIPCNREIVTYLMNDSYADHTFYCGNLNCNFTIKLNSSCVSDLIKFTFSVNDGFQFGPESYDIIRIISNNLTIFESTHYVRTYQGGSNIEIAAINHNILQVITTFSSEARYLSFSFTAINISNVLPTVIINETTSYYFHQPCIYNDKVPYIMSIELSDKFKQRNAKINLFIFTRNTAEFLSFFSNKTLTNQLNFQKCFIEIKPSVFKCETDMESFVLASDNLSTDCNLYLFFQVSDGTQNIGSEGCIFKNNVFNIGISELIG